MSTIFERIISGEIPATKLYEDDKVIVLLDIKPVQKGHSLVITKKPYQWMQDCDDETLAYAFIIAKKMMLHMKQTLGCDFVHVVVEGKEVPHFHIHLIPSTLEVKNAEWQHNLYEEGEMEIYKEKLTMTI